tara:strand:- start:2396 stop:3175 length:780 start_codon:yes stop_codon:yes gene_type:complete
MKQYNKICTIDMSKSSKSILEELQPVWGKFKAYHIENVNTKDFEKEYEEAAEKLGEIRLCHPVNDKSTEFSKSRDIKYNPEIYHYFASNTRQPLHTDYAYYHETESPDWLMLYCMQPSEYGGKTHLLSTESLISILKKYNPKLLEDIKVDVTWKYNGKDGDKIHKKPILEGHKINWNYWQIKEELNTPEVMKIREEFFTFLEKVIVDGCMYDFSKIWKPGDCIIFNDKFTLHGRDAFLGQRWLKDHAFYSKQKERMYHI